MVVMGQVISFHWFRSFFGGILLHLEENSHFSNFLTKFKVPKDFSNEEIRTRNKMLSIFFFQSKVRSRCEELTKIYACTERWWLVSKFNLFTFIVWARITQYKSKIDTFSVCGLQALVWCFDQQHAIGERLCDHK